MDRRSAGQEHLLLMEFRIKSLEDARLAERLQVTELTVQNIQAEVRSISEISRSIGLKLDEAVERLGKKQDAEYKTLREGQLQFMASIRGAMWVAGGLGAVAGAIVAFAPVISKVLPVLAAG